ncbi:hypothetical protein [Kitasatospora viridis]|uniref:Uncharacterized protein n=1 Tax=Kitasatospora viridis TaxID=281105 RepID=A0A561UD04_9ACTN|nr:hypothetical protein [Kitasatospora viridis]TWF97231.1 hypothetical protein FHX73_111011 [Kitasatospora viridis]
MSTPSSSTKWEDAISYFADGSQDGTAGRGDVTGDTWITGHGVELVLPGSYDPTKYDFSWASDPTDVVSYYSSEYGSYEYTTSYIVVVWGSGNWTAWLDQNGKQSHLSQFSMHALDTLNALLGSPGHTTTTALGSFDAAIEMVTRLQTWIGELVTTLKGWTDPLNADDSDLQGSAAGELKSYLTSVGQDMQDMWTLLTYGGDPVAALQGARDALSAGLSKMLSEYWAWRGDSGRAGITNEWDQEGFDANPQVAYPNNCLKYALKAMMQGSPVLDTSGSTPKVTVNGNDTSTDAFWSTLETNGKNIWTQGVEYFLDHGASIAMNGIVPAYTTLGNLLQGITVAPETPAPAAITPPDPGSGDGPGGGPGGGAGDGGPGGDGSGGNGAGGPGGKGPGNLGAPPPPKTKYDLNGNNQGAGPNGGGPNGNVPLLGSDGKQLTGPDGKPWTVPPGSHVDANGNVIGPDGKPLLGPDGKPEKAPPGAYPGGPINLGTGPTGPGGGGTFKAPPGATVDGNGMLIGKDGKPVLDANGNPVYAGKGATVGKDGQLLDANGDPVSNQEQLLANEEHAMGESLNPLGSGARGYVSGDDFGIPTSGSGGLTKGLSLEGLSAPKSVPTEGGIGLTGGTMGISRTALANGGALSPEDIAGQEALAERAAAEQGVAGEQAAMSASEEAQLMGRSVATTGGAGMPPMMPGGGAGAGGAAGGQERQRTTWLAEDEDVWGTDTGAVDGVIGR